MIARVLVCEPTPMEESQRLLFITEGWKVEAAVSYAKKIGLKPLFIINVRRK